MLDASRDRVFRRTTCDESCSGTKRRGWPPNSPDTAALLATFHSGRQSQMTDPRTKAVAEIKAVHLFDIVIDLKPGLNIGDGPFGRRVLFGSAGGSFEGPKLRGDVLEGGGDWALFRPDGTM